jgi:sporulation protein YlmC with PRC-barrel domain
MATALDDHRHNPGGSGDRVPTAGRRTRRTVTAGVTRSSDAPVAFMGPDSVDECMAEILAENLSGKAVTGTDGAEMGMLYNITMDLETGRLRNLIIDPNDHLDNTQFDVDEQGHLLVPVDRVQAVKDHMIVQR